MPVATRSVDHPGMGPKKSLFVVMTVVGCIAILWPTVFSPWMFGVPPSKPSEGSFKGPHGGPVTLSVAKQGCCGRVMLDQQKFSNASQAIAHPGTRKRLNLLTGEMSLRQERPPQMRPDAVHPAMRERGRAIPDTLTMPIVERPPTPKTPPRIVPGRPGPIPGVRPPMGAGAAHQAPTKASSMGFLMPLYTFGIVAFFVYTVMKLVMKPSTTEATPGYVDPILRPSPAFANKVFGQEKNGIPNMGGDAMTALAHSNTPDWELERKIADLEEICLLKKKLQETEANMNKIIAAMGTVPKAQETQNGTLTKGNIAEKPEPKHSNEITKEPIKTEEHKVENGGVKHTEQKLERDTGNDRSVKILGMEVTSSCEGGQKWSRPTTPMQYSHEDEPQPEPQSIFLEGSLPHDSQILVADAETHMEQIFDDDFEGDDEEPAVVLSSKMTLSLINMDPVSKKHTVTVSSSEEEEELDNDEIDVDLNHMATPIKA